jgi:hypothetical protein
MKTIILSIALLITSNVFAQPPKLYIHIVSHNEPNDNLQTTLNYTKAKSNLLQLANIVDSKNAKWNLQTSDGLVLGALNDQASTSTNIFSTLSSTPFNDNVEIDPRSKNMNGRNIADQWYLLDSLGANPTTHLGGCIYVTTNSAIQPIDWEQYRNPIIGNIYGNSWKCTIITGAGSYPPHTNDLNDFGVFKPDTATNFYQHNPSKNLWCLGTGCAPLLDSLKDEQAIIDLIQGQVDSIQNGLWPSNKFYVTRIMTNQREYGPLFFQKISKVIDSLNLIPSSKLQWATISETFTAFQAWQTASSLDHSQWKCGQTATGLFEEKESPSFIVYPNPSNGQYSLHFNNIASHHLKIYDITGRLIDQKNIIGDFNLNLSHQANGLYILKIDENIIKKIVKE